MARGARARSAAWSTVPPRRPRERARGRIQHTARGSGEGRRPAARGSKVLEPGSRLWRRLQAAWSRLQRP
eukprot:3201474-Prymnesium_polylepis.1